MKTRTFLPIVAVLFVAVTPPASAQVSTLLAPRKSALNTVEICNNVASNATANAYTVPAGMRLVVTDMIISNGNATKAGFLRIGRSGISVTAFICVPAESAFSHSFASGLQFKAGDIVELRNGSSAGSIDFSLYGYLVKTPTP